MPSPSAAEALPQPGRLALALALMAASGFAALGYQIVWTQQSAVWLGHEAAAVLAVVAAFFGGSALGALALGARIERSAHPARWYAACEAVIGGWALVLALLIAPASRALLALIGEQPSAWWQWSVAFGGSFLLLLPATAAMGATLPAMERALAQGRTRSAALAALYAGNTFGAVLGVLAAAFWLVPALGLAQTALVCALLNLLCAAAAPWLFAGTATATAAAPATGPTHAAPSVTLTTLATLAATGLLGIGYEVVVVRVLSQVSENTVYTFALLLAVYLVGTAIGASVYQRWRTKHAAAADSAAVRQRLLHLLCAACLLGIGGLWGAEALKAALLQATGAGLANALAAEAALAVAAFLAPTLVMGALFSHLALQAREAGIGFGRALGVNTLGAAAAPLLFGVLLVPAVGPKLALLLVPAGLLALTLRRAPRAPAAWALGGGLVLLAVWAPPLAFVDVPEGGRILSYRDGATAAVSVVEDAQGVARLRIDNRQQEGSSATGLADARQALLPLLLHPAPRQALFLGLGTGVTASAATLDPALRVDAVELLPEVIEASAQFRDGDLPPRLQVIAADARRHVRASTQRHDLIVSDNFHPARSGSAALYTVEHFQAVRARLADDGVFCQWLPLHQLDLDTLRSIVRSFLAVYPQAGAVLATNSLETPVLGLVSRRDGGRFDVERLRERLAAARWATPPADFGLGDGYAVLGSFVAGPQALARFSAGAALNTDDHPVVAYSAPRVTYAPDAPPRDRLLALLASLDVADGELFASPAGSDFSARLAAYRRARDQFLVAGRDVQPSADVRRMLAQVQAPLLGVLRESPDFRPAYDPLLRMAQALAASDPPAAQALLAELQRLQPARVEAAQLLRTIEGSAR